VVAGARAASSHGEHAIVDGTVGQCHADPRQQGRDDERTAARGRAKGTSKDHGHRPLNVTPAPRGTAHGATPAPAAFEFRFEVSISALPAMSAAPPAAKPTYEAVRADFAEPTASAWRSYSPCVSHVP